MSSSLIRATALVAFALICASAHGQAQPLNDTGIIVCHGPDAPCDPIAHKKQDAIVGRDAARRTPGSGLVTNTAKGFSFTKISRSGAVLADDAALGDQAGDWACTRDNVTGLLWEVKATSPSHFRYMNNTYSWYQPDTTKNGGSEGTSSAGSCNVAGRCDTNKFVEDLNAANLCGRNNWTLPSPGQITNIFDFGRNDGGLFEAFFPNIGSAYPAAYWRNRADFVWLNKTLASDSTWAWRASLVTREVSSWPKLYYAPGSGVYVAAVHAVSPAQ